jgi:hypothetical protein
MFKQRKLFLSVFISACILPYVSSAQEKSLCFQKNIPATVIKFREIGERIVTHQPNTDSEQFRTIRTEIMAKFSLPVFDFARFKVSKLDNGPVYFEYRPNADCADLVIFGVWRHSKILIEKCQEVSDETHCLKEGRKIMLYKPIYFAEKSADYFYMCEFTFDFDSMRAYAGIDDGDFISNKK